MRAILAPRSFLRLWVRISSAPPRTLRGTPRHRHRAGVDVGV